MSWETLISSFNPKHEHYWWVNWSILGFVLVLLLGIFLGPRWGITPKFVATGAAIVVASVFG